MTMDLTGIENEAEFFPAGALSASLQEELREIAARWLRKDDEVSPIERLSRCADSYLALLRQIRNTKDDARRIELRTEATHALVTALGYEYKRLRKQTAMDGDTLVPCLSVVADEEGRDAAWLLEAPLEGASDEASDPLGGCFEPDQFPEDEREFAETSHAIEEVLGDGIFGLRNAPRYVLVMALSQLVLIDRHKWPARSVLRFDLQEIYSRQDRDTLAVMACLISREARVPRQGIPIADRIEEEAQRNANAVTTSLKRTVRDAIEILGQEVLDVTGGKYPSGPRKSVWIEGPELSLECLRYMYRLLFLFYAEANPRLNILDLKDPVYATGYSIEALRELESVRLRTPVEKNGTYLWQSLQRTLTMLYAGNSTAMRLPAVKVSLLDPESTPILSEINLRNEAVQKVIRLLSLKQSRSGTARISYAKLGIGQLGAVYETLISFTGVVAKQDLIELRLKTGRGTSSSDEDTESADDQDQEDSEAIDADDDMDDALEDTEDAEDETISRRDKIDFLAPSYFVPRSRAVEFRPEEIVFDGAEARVYKKGTFIYRLAGRDREKSASYYTPEPLARLLVKHALLERCKDLTTDELLDLKILEPAMGSAAFLVETTNQLADLYLERKQKEVGKTIPQDQIIIEKQKVRAFIADRNCFGVDLNPVAVELGAISLWLNSLHASEFTPWFGDQLHAGNSLIGARRASYPATLMTARKKDDLWLNQVPQEIGWKSRLPEGHIWQFLLPAKDMAKFDTDKSITEFADAAQQSIKAWRKGGFFDKLEPHETKLLQKLSRIVEELFDIVAADLARSRASSNDAITLWPDKRFAGVEGLDFHEKARRLSRLVGADHATNTLPYKRLKTAMDAWCALWLWPLDKADKLPSRPEFLQGMAMILEGGFMPDGSLAAPSMAEFVDTVPDFFDALEPDAPAANLFKAAARKQKHDLFRETDVDSLVQEVDWLGVAVDVAKEARFVHYDLIFADILKERGGFDIIVGNPPWSKPSWNGGLVLADIDPFYANFSAADARRVLPEALQKAKGHQRFLHEFVLTRGAMEVTSSAVMHPFAGGGSNNLYKCFIDLSFRLMSEAGNISMIHQDSHLTDTQEAAGFRGHWYHRIISHFHFRNELKSKNFSEIGNTREFSLNLYGAPKSEIKFTNAANMLLASQLAESLLHDGAGEVPSLKNRSGKWEIKGHKDRITILDDHYLRAISRALGELGSYASCKLIPPFSTKIAAAIAIIFKNPTLSQNNLEWQVSTMWTEGASVTAGVLERRTDFPADISKAVLSGSMLFVGNPLYKAPRRNCRNHRDFESIDLNNAPDDFVPRTNYQYVEQGTTSQPRLKWDSTKSYSSLYRIGLRKMMGQNGERTLSGALIPREIGHIDAIVSAAFRTDDDLLTANALWLSLPFDFLIKATNRQNLYGPDLGMLPWVKIDETALHRGLRLACLTVPYAELWDRNAASLHVKDWSSTDPRLRVDGVAEGPATWDRTAGLRTEFARRMALVEIDVLVAQALGLTVDQLLEIYRIYFPVLQENEAGTWYDHNGRIAWTCSKGLPGVGYLEDGKSPSRKRWEQILESGCTKLECQAVVDFMPGGPQTVTRTFEGPFDTCDRIEDYKRAWAYFEAAKEQEAAA
ncbi:MAG: N-6 DNA methylase [Hyphomicrobiaceae bacterium]